MTDEVAPYGGDGDVLEVVRKFESCEYAPDDFGHGLHLTVALVYLLESGYDGALERMRRGLRTFVGHHKLTGVYHETLTVFWMRRVRAFVERADGAFGPAALAGGLARACADSRVVFDYYTRERLHSEEARSRWLDPDLKPLDF
jgi:hypothetical protein